jgi:hypothetical protein
MQDPDNDDRIIERPIADHIGFIERRAQAGRRRLLSKSAGVIVAPCITPCYAGWKAWRSRVPSEWVKATLAVGDEDAPKGSEVYINLAQAGAISPCKDGWKIWLSPNHDEWGGFYVVKESPEQLLKSVLNASRS